MANISEYKRFFDQNVVLPSGLNIDRSYDDMILVRKVMKLDNVAALNTLRSVRHIDVVQYNEGVYIPSGSLLAYYEVTSKLLHHMLSYRGFKRKQYPDDLIFVPPVGNNAVKLYTPRLVLAFAVPFSNSCVANVRDAALPVLQVIKDVCSADTVPEADTLEEVVPEEPSSVFEGVPVTASGQLVLAPELLANIVKSAVKEAMADIQNTVSPEPESDSEDDIDQSLEAVCTLYRNGELNIAQASELSGLSRADFRSRFSSIRCTV